MTELIDLHRSYSAPGCSNTQTWVQVDRPSIPRPVLPFDSWNWLKPSSQAMLDLWEKAREHPMPDSDVVEVGPLPPLPEPIVKLIDRMQAGQKASYPGRRVVVDIP